MCRYSDTTYCELCDLDDSTCQHGLARRTAARERTAALLVSPRGMAHFDGCPHKEDPDYSRWGTIDRHGAWQALANGEEIETVSEAGAPLVATSRCLDCVQHGPW